MNGIILLLLQYLLNTNRVLIINIILLCIYNIICSTQDSA